MEPVTGVTVSGGKKRLLRNSITSNDQLSNVAFRKDFVWWEASAAWSFVTYRQVRSMSRALTEVC